MKKKFFVIICIILLSSFGIITTYVKAGNDNDENEGSYYFAYGDSITAGKGMDEGGTYCFECTYMERMRVLYDPGHTSDHIGIEGGGNSISFDHGYAWDPTDVHEGGTRYYYHWTNHSNNTYFIWMLGVNDIARYYGYQENEGPYHTPDTNFSVGNYTKGMLKIYNETIENETIPMMCNPTGTDNGVIERYPGFAYENYSQYYNESFNIFKNYSIKCIPMWDAIDLNPWDGIMQPCDSDFNGKGVHLNEDGHNAIAYMLWYFINGWDYNLTYYPSTKRLNISADYNETIFINNTRYEWNTSRLQVLCTTNDSTIGFTIQTAFNGSEMLRFDIVKGCNYEIFDEIFVPSFIAINGGVNNSIIFDSNPTINWTVITNASQYHLEIDNNNNFASPEINYTNINQWTYPASCEINETRVAFTLPDSLPSHDTYYMRVRAYIR